MGVLSRRFLVVLVAALGLLSALASAATFRGADIRWERPPGTTTAADVTVRIFITPESTDLIGVVKAYLYNPATPSATGTDVLTADGSGISIYASTSTLVGTGVDHAGVTYSVYEKQLSVVLPTADMYELYIYECCRFGGLLFGESSLPARVHVIMDFRTTEYSTSIMSSTPGLLQIGNDPSATVTLPVTLPKSSLGNIQAFTCRPSRAYEDGMNGSPVAFTIAATAAGDGCVIAWGPTYASYATSLAGNRTAVQAVISLVPTATAPNIQEVSYDFVLEIVQLTALPTCSMSPSFVEVTASNPVTIGITTTQPTAGSVLQLMSSSLPTGSYLTTTSGATPLASQFVWTPTVDQCGSTYLIQVTAATTTTAAGTVQTNCSTTVQVDCPATSTPAPTTAASTPAPTTAATPAPTTAATPAPTDAATPAPTMAATPAPTTSATPAPTTAATPAPTDAATPAPTTAATPAPTDAATPAPTTAATPAPTDAATPAPTTAATPAPTDAATPAPMTAATPAPTDVATPAPTTAATPAPTDAATPAPTTAATPAPTTASTPAPTTASTPAPTAGSTPAPGSQCTGSTVRGWVTGGGWVQDNGKPSGHFSLMLRPPSKCGTESCGALTLDVPRDFRAQATTTESLCITLTGTEADVTASGKGVLFSLDKAHHKLTPVQVTYTVAAHSCRVVGPGVANGERRLLDVMNEANDRNDDSNQDGNQDGQGEDWQWQFANQGDGQGTEWKWPGDGQGDGQGNEQGQNWQWQGDGQGDRQGDGHGQDGQRQGGDQGDGDQNKPDGKSQGGHGKDDAPGQSGDQNKPDGKSQGGDKATPAPPATPAGKGQAPGQSGDANKPDGKSQGKGNGDGKSSGSKGQGGNGLPGKPTCQDTLDIQIMDATTGSVLWASQNGRGMGGGAIVVHLVKEGQFIPTCRPQPYFDPIWGQVVFP